MPGSGSGRDGAFIGTELACRPVDMKIHVFESLPLPVALVDARRQCVLHANEAFGELAGTRAGTLEGRFLGSILPGLDRDDWLNAVDTAWRTGRATRIEEVALVADAWAGIRWWDFTVTPLEGGDDEATVLVSAAEATSRVSQRLCADEKLRQLEDRSEKALREANHRARNSLQLVVSLLGLQSAGITLPDERARFSEATRRVAVIAEAHINGSGRVLSGPPGRIDLADYLRRVCLRVAEGDPALEARIGLDAAVDPAPIQVDRAAPLGLLVHEVVAEILLQRNCLPPPVAVRMRLEHHPEREGYRLTLVRTGPPAHAGFPASPQTLGRQFVPALAEQVGCLIEEEDERAGLLVVAIPT
jgi:hypothetical protein